MQENRQRFATAFFLNADDLVTAQQVHGTAFSYVSREDKGRGAKEQNSAFADTDALITREKKLPLLLGFADCVPLIIYAPHNSIVAVVHAGWRGTLEKIAAKVVRHFCDEINKS